MQETKDELTESLNSMSEQFKTMIDDNNKKFRNAYEQGESIDMRRFRWLLDVMVSDMALCFTNKINLITEAQSYQLNISLSVIQSHFIINDLILTGHIIEANILTRKQLENVTRLVELDSIPIAKLHKKTPNISTLSRKFDVGKTYGELSEIAHFATTRVTQVLGFESGTDGKTGPPLFPIFSNLAFEAYKIHGATMILFINWIIEFAKNMYPSQFDDRKELLEDLHSQLILLAFETEILKIKEKEQ